MNYQRICRDGAATSAAGAAFAALLRPSDIVVLTGRLGAGKTTFVQGVARGLGVVERVTSPTFTMLRLHEAHNQWGIATLLHSDLYRVESVAEVRDLDLGELVEEAGVAFVEWGELAAGVFGREVLSVHFDLADDLSDETRVLSVSGAIDAARAHALMEWSSE